MSRLLYEIALRHVLGLDRGVLVSNLGVGVGVGVITTFKSGYDIEVSITARNYLRVLRLYCSFVLMTPNDVISARFALWAENCTCGLMFVGANSRLAQFGKSIMPL